MMNRIITSICVLLFSVGVAKADCGYHQQKKTKEEFIKEQRDFIIAEAKLSDKEAEAFFKVYAELQDKKRTNTEEIGNVMRQAKLEPTEKEYNELLIRVYQLRKSNADLDLEYYYRFAEILPKSKIYQVMRAESRFQRQIIRGMHHRSRNMERKSSNK